MPCTGDGFSEPRAMAPDEAWRSFSRHHAAMESELEAYRNWAHIALTKLAAVKKAIPGVDVSVPKLPEETPSWDGTTYRDKNGKWPSDIREHCDWLSNEDY